MKMACDICKQVHEYSECAIHHYTLRIDGELKPHTHVCLKCEKDYDLKIQSIYTIKEIK